MQIRTWLSQSEFELLTIGNMMLPLLRVKLLLTLTLWIAIPMAAPEHSYAQAQGNAASANQQQAQPEATSAKPAPYDGQLARLSEILGALQYIESLCKSAQANDWRDDMSKLLAAEVANEPQRQERFTAAFNRGYRTFAAVYTECTANAKAAEKTYRHEGATLAQEITSRFGN